MLFEMCLQDNTYIILCGFVMYRYQYQQRNVIKRDHKIQHNFLYMRTYIK